MTADEFLEQMSEINPHSLFPDNMKEAIIGYVERNNMEPQILLDREKCINILMNEDGMDQEEAMEFFDYNVLGSFMGEEGTPCFATLIK